MAYYNVDTSDATGSNISTNVIWDSWYSNDTSSTADYDTTGIWVKWTVTSDCTSTASTDITWSAWVNGNQMVGTGNNIDGLNVDGFQRSEETEEEKAERLEAQRVAREEQRVLRIKTEREKKRARVKATQLFKMLVGDTRYALFKKNGYAEVVAPHSKKRYRLRPGREVDVMESNFGNQVDHTLCIHHPHGERLPQMDTLVHQMLLILAGEGGEKTLYEIANRNNVYRPANRVAV